MPGAGTPMIKRAFSILSRVIIGAGVGSGINDPGPAWSARPGRTQVKV